MTTQTIPYTVNVTFRTDENQWEVLNTGAYCEPSRLFPSILDAWEYAKRCYYNTRRNYLFVYDVRLCFQGVDTKVEDFLWEKTSVEPKISSNRGASYLVRFIRPAGCVDETATFLVIELSGRTIAKWVKPDGTAYMPRLDGRGPDPAAVLMRGVSDHEKVIEALLEGLRDGSISPDRPAHFDD